ncbi:hypothetical protein BV22DRAFT_926867 [Leucogyrophana mollusca]|uniref:Uncharacterized protein n=1 Tax=Leucogyrophana mollusca TaxID=85980 RepID=A0ACB8AXS3_9AGAM|nr:hypothetical protein BV22DRAFT_926867 [Leucogyrophana mollusca]
MSAPRRCKPPDSHGVKITTPGHVKTQAWIAEACFRSQTALSVSGISLTANPSRSSPLRPRRHCSTSSSPRRDPGPSLPAPPIRSDQRSRVFKHSGSISPRGNDPGFCHVASPQPTLSTRYIPRSHVSSRAAIFTIIALISVFAYFAYRSRLSLPSLLMQVVINVSKPTCNAVVLGA